METTIIMTNCKSPYGSYIEFKIKGGAFIGEVDTLNKREHGKTGYRVFYGEHGRSRQIADRSNKDSAIALLQESIKAGIQGPVEFKWNVMQYKYKFA